MRGLRTLTIALLVTAAGCGGGGSAVESPPAVPPPPPPPPPILPPVTAAWHIPSCNTVSGAAPVTFSSDGGLHRAPLQSPADPHYFTYGVAALAAGSTLAAIVGTSTIGTSAEIYFSTDAGCSWQPSGQILPDVYYYLDAALTAAGGYAYAWSTNNRSIHVIEPSGAARELKREGFAPWVSGPYGLGIDPNDPERIRISLWECQRASCGVGSVIMETADEGETWTRVGVPAPYGALELLFSRSNFDHAVALSITPGAHVTFDGGNQWLPGQGIPATWTAQEAAIGPDGQTVWLLVSSGSHVTPPLLSAMYVSYDGGLNYQQAFAASDENPFVPGNPPGDPLARARIFPHPSDRDVVYLAYASRANGTSYLYRYDAGLGQLTKHAWPSAEGGVWSLAFNPADAETLYLGLAAAE